MYKRKQSERTGRLAGNQVAVIGLVSAVFLVFLAAMWWNVSGLKDILSRSTVAYVEDIACQLTDDISSRLNYFAESVHQVAESVSRLETREEQEDYLRRKGERLELDVLVVMDREGNIWPEKEGAETLRQSEELEMLFHGKSELTYLDGQSILFSEPVPSNQQIDKIVIGVRNKEAMQSLIQPVSFSGKGLTCIIDSEGEVVISPTDLKPFLHLDDIFKQGKDKQISEAITQMKEDMKTEESGIIPFTAVDGRELLLSYHSLGVNQWYLLTLVPEDLISQGADFYMFRTFAIAGGSILLLAVLLLSFVRFYQKNRRELEKIAFTDALTGGANNAAFQMECNRRIRQSAPASCSVVYLNIKDFKLVNEKLGMDAGNQILCDIYGILNQNIGEEELAARAEADHFFLLLNEKDPERISRRLADMVAEIRGIEENREYGFSITLLRGACLADSPETDCAIYQDRARTASMFREEGEGEVCVFYSPDMMEQIKKEQELTSMLDRSLENGEFQVFLQPKIQLENRKLGGAEALVRWSHPERGMIPPSEFIPVFEKSEAICLLDRYVYEEVCRTMAAWQKAGDTLCPVSFNLSRMHFRNPDFLDFFAEVKENYQIPDGMLEFELTESIFFESSQMEAVKQAIGRMHEEGFLCSLDDFGFGYSSLAMLREFDVDTIKLDRMFFLDIENKKAQCVISSFIGLADQLEIGVVAEGIETEEQLDYLYRAGCGMVQGYLFSRPLPVPEFETWKKEWEEKNGRE